jgi:ABC-2 type transport system ATP-binding protein
MIAVDHLTRRFGDRVAVEDVTFDVREGEVFGLLGPNGAGKTTTLRAIAGLIRPTSGRITTTASIGFLTETPGLWDHLTVEDNIRVYARLFGVSRPADAVERVLRLFELWDRRGDRVAQLSKGMKQKLALARALVHDPSIVLLDEPTANLDPQTARTVRDLLRTLRTEGRAIVVSTHNLDEIERLADRVALIRRTLVAIGEPAALRRDLFGRRLRVRFTNSEASMSTMAAEASRAGGRDVHATGNELSMVLDDPDRLTPAIVRALVAAGAQIREVAEEQPALEDVYLKLLGS